MWRSAESARIKKSPGGDAWAFGWGAVIYKTLDKNVKSTPKIRYNAPMSETVTTSPITGTLPRHWVQAHKHHYRLRIWRGRLVAMCDCSDYIEAEEIERRVNEQA